jgi:RNA-binding protein
MPFLKGSSMLQLSSLERRELRARAHNLNPVVSIAENGLTEAVLKEIDVNLNAHELIKIRVYGDSRDDRLAYLEKICTELAAAPVQHIGKLLVVFRPAPAATAAVDGKKAAKPRRPAPKARRQTKRSLQG